MMSRLEIALNQIRAARGYTLDLLNNINSDDWFRQPADGVTHVAWQVGHLAVANYRLALVRIRGEQPADAEFVPEGYMKLFGKGSTPTTDAAIYPEPNDIRRVYEQIHNRIIEENSSLTEEVLDEGSDPPHPMFNSKYGALLWCAQHEFLHAGQIGLLRRHFGNAPLR